MGTAIITGDGFIVELSVVVVLDTFDALDILDALDKLDALDTLDTLDVFVRLVKAEEFNSCPSVEYTVTFCVEFIDIAKTGCQIETSNSVTK